MPQKIVSDIAGFEGSVMIADPLTLAQAHVIEAGMRPPEKDADGRWWLTDEDELKLPAVLACVEKWEIPAIPEGVTLHTFPFSPRPQTHKLIDLVFTALKRIYIGEINIPNA